MAARARSLFAAGAYPKTSPGKHRAGPGSHGYFPLASAPGVPYKTPQRMKSKILLALTLSVFSLAAVHAADALDEKAFQKHMKAVGKTAKAFKANFESKNAAALEKDGAATAEAYKGMAAFFKARKNDDAAKWSDDAATGASGAAVAAKAGDWDKVKAEWNAVGKNCKACHDKYREKLDDGSYKIK